MPKKQFEKYNKLLNADGLSSEYEEFYEGGISQTKNVDGKEVKIYLYPNDYGQLLDLDSYILMSANYYAQNIFDDTENLLENTPKEDLSTLVLKYHFYLRKIITEFESNISIKQLKTFYERLIDILPKIDELFAMYFKIHELKYHSILSKDDPSDTIDMNYNRESFSRIKWLAKTNILTTLFYDLMNGQDRNESIIEATKKDIIDLIVNNFVDSDGSQFSKHTIETNLRDSTPEKKAKRGDRIELGNVKVKK